MRGGRIGIVGGSIAGCAAALAAARGGADEVTVFERARDDLRERGVGLGVQADRFVELAEAGFLDENVPWTRIDSRRWLTRDGDAPMGRSLAVHPFPFRMYSWGSLWRELRRRVPESVAFHTGTAAVEVSGSDGSAGASVRLADGTVRQFDVVIGADGYRSVARTAVAPGSTPEYAGYVTWRGTFPAASLELLSGGTWAEHEFVTAGFDGGHLIGYRIPGEAGALVNWLVYGRAPKGLVLDPDEPTSVPPGRMTAELVEHLHRTAERELPSYWAAALGLTEPGQLLVQPIYDLEVPRYAARRVLLVGDAATVARPHTGAGAVKALQDAAVLAGLWAGAASWEELLEAYDAARRPVGSGMVAMGRRLGAAQVVRTPDWSALDGAGFRAWLAGLSGGDAVGGRRLDSGS
jgi:2-polyprenyl-6-methoxyphenol hydroxylase-like FAD-dependent oxidoreductase